MSVRIQLRRDTAANWTSTNPTLTQGEPGYETDTGKIKYGDGTTAWNSLAYAPAAAVVDGTIVNADVNASAAIAGSKISPDFGSQTVATTGVFSHALGSAAAPTVTFTGDTNTGIYSPGADQVAISTNGTKRIEIQADGDIDIDNGGVFYDATNNRLAIGTTTPRALATINGGTGAGFVDVLQLNAGALASNSGPGITFNINYGNYDVWGDWQTGAIRSAGSSASIDYAGYLSFYTNSGGSKTSLAERARIDSSGRLLVGTSNSTDNARFDSKVSVVGTGNGLFPGLIVNGYTGTTNANAAPFIDLGRSRGTTDGSYTEVANNDTLGYIVFRGADGAGWSDGAIILCQADGDWTTSGDTTDSPGRLVFSTTADGASSPTERMRIGSNGQTYWGSSAPGAASFGTSIGRLGLAGFVESYRDVNGTFAAVQFGGTAGYAQVMGDGDLENTNNRYTGLSDVKFKQNIEDATSQWDDIKAIQVRKYELIASPERRHIGCVAQELEQVCPGLVVERETQEGETYKSVAYSVLYMKAVKALQEAMERIETLEAKVAALESA